MTIAGYALAASPLLPWWAIAGFAGLAVLALLFGALRRARGTAWRLLATAVLLAILPVCSAQRYTFQLYGQLDGLSNLTPTSLLQDRTGFLWVGTQNGLFR